MWNNGRILRQLVLDEIEGEVKRLLEYIEGIDLDSKRGITRGN